jgi:hypothetical protein
MLFRLKSDLTTSMEIYVQVIGKGVIASYFSYIPFDSVRQCKHESDIVTKIFENEWTVLAAAAGRLLIVRKFSAQIIFKKQCALKN